MQQIQQLEIGIVLLVACLSFFFLGYQWANSQQNSYNDSIGSEEDNEHQKLDQQVREYKEREKQFQQQIEDLKKQLAMGNQIKYTDL
ncbi:unnamed protein product [Paramecium sonneborni]|uniref:Uncharacterized protein n=1 Tax=Paramecium sonneborni TaxID=65129 RepID=A0A8S1KVV9_9CILI|nr:unnamed protein product [Paramecium sonneborni]